MIKLGEKYIKIATIYNTCLKDIRKHKHYTERSERYFLKNKINNIKMK